MDSKTEKVLRHDSLYESEKILGNKHWSEFNEFEQAFSFLKFLDDNEKKKNHLQSIGDTYWGMSWDQFKNLIKQHGFVEALSYDFNHDKNEVDEAIIYYHLTKGLIIWATSYWNKKDVNEGTLYGEIQANSEEDCKTIWSWLSTGGCIDSDKMIYKTSQDVREGLFSRLVELESAGTFLSQWIKKDRFLWFVDYVESKQDGYNYKEITKEKISKCPKELQSIIGETR